MPLPPSKFKPETEIKPTEHSEITNTEAQNYSRGSIVKPKFEGGKTTLTPSLMDLHENSKQGTDYEVITSFLPFNQVSQGEINRTLKDTESPTSRGIDNAIVRKFTNETFEIESNENKSNMPIKLTSTKPSVLIHMSTGPKQFFEDMHE